MAAEQGRITPIHPSIMGILQLLPPDGTAFPKEARQTWLKTLAAALELIYGDETAHV